MSELVTKSVAEEQLEQKIETRTAVERIAGFTVGVAAAVAVLAVLVATAVYAQDKYSLKSPSGIAFSDFKGYEDWAVVSSARTDEVFKVIVANRTMINAYRAGVPGNGQPFPDGSKIVKLQWKPKKSTEAPFVVDVPDVFTQAFVIEKDSKRFPKSGGWGYAVFNYEAASDRFTADPTSLSDCGHACPHGRKGEGTTSSAVREALNRACSDIKYPAQRMSLCEALSWTRALSTRKGWQHECSYEASGWAEPELCKGRSSPEQNSDVPAVTFAEIAREALAYSKANKLSH